MEIVIIGDGKVGSMLATQLSAEGHSITIVDRDTEKLEQSLNTLDVNVIKGNGANYKVQNEAGVGSADLLIAVTSQDEVNIICCMLGKKLGAKHAIARVRNPEYAENLNFLKEELGLSMTINPERAAAREIVKAISFPSAVSVRSLVRGRVEIVECRLKPGSPLIGQKMFSIRVKYGLNILLCILERKGVVSIPGPDDVFMPDDKIHITGDIPSILTFLRLSGHTEHSVHSVMIIGGGKTSYYLAEICLSIGLDVKIIEKNPEKCRELCELLPEALVINGDGTDQHLLEEEMLSETDALVALTDMDEENLIVALYAQKRGTNKAIVKINRLEYMDVIRDMGIDSVISPKTITAHQIIQYVRAMQNTMGSKIVAMVRMAQERAEALEFTVTENTRHVGEPLAVIPFKKSMIVAAIVHMGRLTIPDGRSAFVPGDSVIVVTMNYKFNDMNDIFRDNA